MAQQYQVSILYFLFFTLRTNCELVEYVVNGRDANIRDFSYAASLFVIIPSKDRGKVHYMGCGSSILNQDILLTAGHCVNDCNPASKVIASVGSENKYKGTTVPVVMIHIHGNYDLYKCMYDIALLKLSESLKFSKTVGRVAIMRKPPYSEKALIAGWGQVDEIHGVATKILHFTDQRVWARKKCYSSGFMSYSGVFCAQAAKHSKYSSRGDSGSALVVRGYIQIGIAAYKCMNVDRSVVLYTDVAEFYDWIIKSMPKLFCDK